MLILVISNTFKGDNYEQYCILGIEIDLDEIKIIINPEKTEEQPVYDVNTGKVTHHKKVIVQREHSIYSFLDVADEDPGELGYAIEAAFPYNCSCCYDSNTLFVGYNVAHKNYFGRVCLLDDSVPISWIIEKRNELELKFPNHEVGLHFVTSVG